MGVQVICQDPGTILMATADHIPELADLEGDEMMDYQNRLKTFGGVGKWFESGPSIKKHMARAGIFVPDEEHRRRKSVQCVYCRHIFLEWTRNDNPEGRHSEESPDCLFFKYEKTEEELTIRQLIELQKFTVLKKLEEETQKQKAELRDILDEGRRELLNL